MKEIVHIIPLGHEIDRAVRTFDNYKANRAYILATTDDTKYNPEMIKKQVYYLNAVKDVLNSRGISTIVINVDMFDLQEVIKTVSQIVVKEKIEDNEVFVNVSSSGRLTSIGATLSAMANGAQAYYVEADDYSITREEKHKHGLSICTDLKIRFLTSFKFKMPKENGIKILVKLLETPSNELKPWKAIEYLAKEGSPDWKEYSNFQSRNFDRSKKQRGLMKLNKGVLTELQKNGYITRGSLGRYKTIRITDSGKHIACLSGLTTEKFH
ncbi:MAG: DUF6293 family protein [Promethearchaeota archaeon]